MKGRWQCCLYRFINRDGGGVSVSILLQCLERDEAVISLLTGHASPSVFASLLHIEINRFPVLQQRVPSRRRAKLIIT